MSDIDTALIVIDAQESFRHRPYWSERDLAAYLDRQQALIDGASARGLPVIQILHSEPDGVFSPASGYLRALEPLRIAPDAVFTKTRHSAFIGTGLDVWLRQHGIKRLIVSGIRTEQCCETTTRNASDIGFEVDFVTEATLTFDMRADNGFALDAAGIKARTELVLAHRFARIATVDEALAGFADAKAA